MKFVNLTPHSITEITSGVEWPSMGNARCIVEECVIDRIPGAEVSGHYIPDIPIYTTTFGAVTGLPPQKQDVMYIVSLLVCQALPNRSDLVSPGELIRDESGQPIGCRGFRK